ncbi:MAG TPA: hypothetical protein VL335_01930 [Candidatus Paceibacterota bacterium]|jgi:hypothetical protein|nr:hypothetical protein [Candidatus Paceibacterota bacterium]
MNTTTCHVCQIIFLGAIVGIRFERHIHNSPNGWHGVVQHPANRHKAPVRFSKRSQYVRKFGQK